MNASTTASPPLNTPPSPQHAPSGSAAGTRAPAPQGRRTVDAPTRMFHWLFALSFLGAWITAESEHWRLVHVTLGYTFAGLTVFRLLYGLVGPQAVRLSSLGRRVSGLPAWVRGLWQGQALNPGWWRMAQPLAMSVAIVALLLLVTPLTLTGYATYNDWAGDITEELHEFFANAFLLVVLAHIGLVLLLSLLRRRNLAMPMITGRAEGRGPDLVKKNRGWLAALVLLAVLAFGAWQWQQAPAAGGGGPTGEAAADRRSQQADDDD